MKLKQLKHDDIFCFLENSTKESYGIEVFKLFKKTGKPLHAINLGYFFNETSEFVPLVTFIKDDVNLNAEVEKLKLKVEKL